MFHIRSEKGSTLKEKNICLWSKFFTFRVDLFRGGACMQENKYENIYINIAFRNKELTKERKSEPLFY